MWMLFHRNAKTRAVRDGQTLVERCPECGERTTFVEVEVTESFGMFFVDIVDDKQRAFRCSACHEVFDLKEQVPTRSPAEIESDRAAAEHARRELAAAKAVRIEDELAELKKRIGR